MCGSELARGWASIATASPPSQSHRLQYNYFSSHLAPSVTQAGHDCLYSPLRKCTAATFAGLQDFREQVRSGLGGRVAFGIARSASSHSAPRCLPYHPHPPRPPRPKMLEGIKTVASGNDQLSYFVDACFKHTQTDRNKPFKVSCVWGDGIVCVG